MNKLTNSKLRNMIMQELSKIVGEDALVSKSGKEKDSHIRGDLHTDYPFEIEDDEEQNEYGFLEEGSCNDDGTDYSIDTMGMIGDALGVLTHHGYEVDASKGHAKDKKYHHNNYMAKPDLYKVAKYAKKLLHMIPDGYELMDWQRHKIAQISDDISEVYHSLDYDFRDDEC